MRSWEALCSRCGLCCYEKRYGPSGYIIDLGRPCFYLDPVSKLCTVYERRFEVCRQCRKMTVFHALFTSYLPDSCGYVQKFRIWRRFSRRRPPR